MVYTEKERRQFFELQPRDSKDKVRLIDKRRTLIGSAESCDVVLNFPDISPIHAILEILKDGAKIYDLNSKSGTFVNGKKILMGEYKEGDSLRFGSHEYIYKKFTKEDEPPPILDMLSPTLPTKKIPTKPVVAHVPKVKGVDLPIRESFIPRIAYPLAEDPKANYDSYIYEQTENLYPIFKYDYEPNSLEVLILFAGKIYSVDYLPPRKGIYQLVGKGEDSLEFPILGKEERIDFLEVSKGEARVFPLVGYEVLALNDQKKMTGPIVVKEDDMVVFSKGDTQIFVQKTPPPPKVARAPFFVREGNFSKVLAAVYAVVLVILFLISRVNVEEVKLAEEEKAPKRIAQILYKPAPIPPKPIEIPKPPEPTPEKAPEKPIAAPTSPLPGTSKEQIVQIKKADVREFEAKRPPKGPPQKGIPPKSKVDINKSLITKHPSPEKGLPPPPKKKGPPAPYGTIIAKESAGGNVETFKLDFKPNVSRVLSKGESFGTSSSYGTPEGSPTSDEGIGMVGGTGKGGAGRVKGADMGKIGSLYGKTKGIADTDTGVSGLSDKESIYILGQPGRTVILGSMDPDVIKRILTDNLPLFRTCYQREIEETDSSFSGIVKLNFVIGASGSVSKASTSSEDNLPEKVKGCLLGVIKDIRFPRPSGGGVIEVTQPLNLSAKKI
jgi:FHA domain